MSKLIDMDKFIQQMNALAVAYAGKVIGAVLILLIGFWVARKFNRILRRVLEKTQLETTYVSVTVNMTRILFYGLVLLAAMSSLGVPMTSVIALLGTAGLAVALALKDSLNNVAAGIALLILSPFKVDDYVEVGGVGGTIMEINFFHTVLNSPDNRRIVVPNAKVLGDTITNFSLNNTRRVDMVFGVSYDSDLKLARESFLALIEADERILSEPEPVIAVGELANSAINFYVRPWVKTSDFWAVKFDFIENTKLTFDKAGIVIPFPQQDVHLHQAECHHAS